MSTARIELRWKNSHQPCGHITATGRFTASHAAAAAAEAVTQGRSLPARRHRNNSTTRMNTGYSLAAVPSPRTTPAQPGRRRAHNSIPTAVAATAIASKLVNACTITSGDAAMIITSQGRRPAPDDRVVAQIASSQNIARPSAETVKNSTTSIAAGTPHCSCRYVHAFAILIDAYWYMPVSTGYSMYRSCGAPVASVSVNCVL